MKQVFFAAFGLLAALACGPAQAGGHTPTMSEAEARAAVRQALSDGNPRISGAIASALLRHDPKDADS